ncbi:glycosyltransferase family 4 protein [Halobacillus shinanisalinarum]|uniref:Glycosyltransferase family 4 protein n=1 Tax=Halobacillus shinanisalinarum TaxID=2932258 RepID=A0ABY4H2F0_9BACI|nr:glycosyltransferase family 4 protein [Halobacillus shinanisalinarum]UOQ94524.1 glycosyltransferase family 4 protein [Halobacillus shinanisalinarum]
MRVLHISYGSPMVELCKALQSKGVQATSCHFDEHPFKFQPDICLKLNQLPKQERENKIEQFLQESVQKYDIFHFHFGETFFSDKSDMEILKRAGKKMVVHHHGSDIRLLSAARINNPYVKVKPEWTEEKIYNNVAALSKYIDHAIVQDPELEGYISNLYKHTHVIPHTIDVHQFKPQYPEVKQTSPLVIHAPTSRHIKGTEFIVKAVQELQRSGLSFRFKLVEGLSNDEAKNLFAQADIVIDQLRIGSYGYVSSEAMALGKPVICYIREDLVDKYPGGLPIINANPDTITTVLENLIKNPRQRRNTGFNGRTYVTQNHMAEKVVNQYIDIYNKL